MASAAAEAIVVHVGHEHASTGAPPCVMHAIQFGHVKDSPQARAAACEHAPRSPMCLSILISWSLFPLLHACAFGFAAVLVPMALAHRRTGASPFAFGGTDSARDFTARCFYLWLPLADFAFVAFYAWRGDPGPMVWGGFAHAEAFRSLGAVLLVLAMGWVVLAQAAMGSEWMMGVDDRHAGRLLTGGLFAWSRHPVYTGIRATLFGQLLVVGSWPALLLWALAELLVQLQVRFEEEAMMVRHGPML
jgi:protein-S-isoprenylcysteine O-methyltransferase Ste14